MRFTITVLLVLAFAATATAVGIPEADRIHVQRLAAFLTLVDQLADSLWPGMDIHKIPIAINVHDQREYLTGHPQPPGEFKPVDGETGLSQPLFTREGCTRYGPQSGGWEVDLGGRSTAYVGVVADFTTEQYLLLLLHECFHVFQHEYHERGDDSFGEQPELDVPNSALIGLEARILDHMLSDSTGDWHGGAAQFVAVRAERLSRLPAGVVREELESEFNEGTASYVELRPLDILRHSSGIDLGLSEIDSQFHGFRDAAKEFQLRIDRLRDFGSLIYSSIWSRYQLGMAQCLILDRLEPNWKWLVGNKGVTPYDILSARFAAPPDSAGRLIDSAKREFNYDSIFAAQSRLITARTDSIRAVIEAPGIRYRVYYTAASPGFNWRPHGPVYLIPTKLMNEIDARLQIEDFGMTQERISNSGPTLWMGGIEQFDAGELRFSTQKTPCLFRHPYIEWIDTNPAPDSSDFRIEGDPEADGVYRNAKIMTDGFTLTLPRVKIQRAKGVVAIIAQTEDTPKE